MTPSTEALLRQERALQSGAVSYPGEEFEDPLSYLPFSTILEYRRGNLIYTHDQPSTHLYLVMTGGVKVVRIADNGDQTVTEIYRTDDFFGESVLLQSPVHSEQAVAMESVKLMIWTAPALQELIARRPRLSIALLQVLLRRTAHFKARIESFAAEGISRRLARSLIGFGERFGIADEDGIISIPPLTHELLSQYVGTSREIVTFYMIQFRHEGYLSYSRKSISIRAEALRVWLRLNK